MPIYEYLCEACAETVEVIHGVNATPPSSCPSCARGPLERVFSRTNSNFGRHSSPSAERHSKLGVQQQAMQELDRLSEHSKKTGIPLDDLFEGH
jgi:putative FmdB family regulatory protein